MYVCTSLGMGMGGVGLCRAHARGTAMRDQIRLLCGHDPAWLPPRKQNAPSAVAGRRKPPPSLAASPGCGAAAHVPCTRVRYTVAAAPLVV